VPGQLTGKMGQLHRTVGTDLVDYRALQQSREG
jgi:hypothetical protein